MIANQRLSAYRGILQGKLETLSTGLTRPGEALLHLSEDDQSQAHQHEAVSLSLNSLGYTQLRMIKEALDRLAAGDYGTCLACDEPIPPKRLQVVPWARYCVRCQERLDKSGQDALESLAKA